MRWPEFLEKLKEARKLKKDTKLGVPVLTNLIFNGAFDSMIDGPPSLSVYLQMFEDVKAIKKSKAKLPSKKKEEAIGLDEVDSEVKLGFWRSQRCPVVKGIPIEQEFAGRLLERGFVVKESHPIFTFVRGESKDGKKKPCYATPYWRAVFAKQHVFDLFKEQKRELLVYGMVASVTLRHYGEGKEMLIIRMFTGREVTDELIVWPKKDTGKVSEVYKSKLKVGKMFMVWVRPGFYGDKTNGTILYALELL